MSKFLDFNVLRYFKQKLDNKFITRQQLNNAIDNALSAYKQGIVSIVSALPNEGEEGKLYLVPDSNALTNDVFTIWTWENRWVQMGATTFTLSVENSLANSSNPISAQAVSQALDSKLDSSELTSSISDGGTNAVTSGAIYNALSQKLDKDSVVSVIERNSTDAITSGAVFSALEAKINKTDLATVVEEYNNNAITSSAVYTALEGKMDNSNISIASYEAIDEMFT